jgi:serine/threonine protein kinase, bacterial
MKAGSIISGRYEVVKPIGQGGMQDVFLATDRLVQRNVALKTPQPGQKTKRFRDSAVIAAMVNHHNVAKTYDYVEFDSNQYLVEELVKGITLEQFAFEHYMFVDPDLCLRIFTELSKGIAASHAAGVVHRDLKPSNVLVSGTVIPTEIKITDFGIASLTEEVFNEASSSDLTRSSSKTIQGALPYMSPEMMFRKSGDYPGPASDVWSLAAMMFRILTREFPYGEGFDVPAAIKMNQRAEWPSFMASKSQFAPLALELQSVIEDCLKIEPSDRPSATELATKLQNLCCLTTPRHIGTIVNTRYGGSQGLIRCDDGVSVFFHKESIYGLNVGSVDCRVALSRHPGDPYARAHPVVPLISQSAT